MQVNSPDISVLDFSALFDISKAAPEIKLTNASVGGNLAGCTWWYSVQTPSGTYIHQGSSAAPAPAGAWATVTVPEVWPQPMGQVEWDGNNPYKVTLYVKDTANTIFSVTKSVLICRPNGNTIKSIGNFGVAAIRVNVQCNKARLVAEDSTNYVYRNMAGVQVSRKYTLAYPMDNNGNQPAAFVVNNIANAFLPISYSGEGYQVYFDAVQDYTVDGMTVRVKYKFKKLFDVLCNVDLCPLLCEVQKMYDALDGTPCSAETKDKLLRINAKLNMLQIALMQPLCGVDVPALIEEIKALGGFSCSCVGVSGDGINGGIDPNSDLNIDFDTCGDITGVAVVNGNNIVMTLKDKTVSFVLDPEMPDQDTFQITEVIEAETCKRTYKLHVDMTKIGSAGACCPTVLPVQVHATANAPADCPANIYAVPLDVYSVDDATVIGNASSADDLVSILNSNAGWSALGIAYNMGYCKVGFFFNANVAAQDKPASVHVGEPGNSGGTSPYVSHIKDYCTDAVKLSSNTQFPASIWVRFVANGTKYQIRPAVDPADLVAKLNAHANNPGLTFSPNPNDPSTLGIVVTNPTQNASAVEIWHDYFQFIVVGANHHANLANQERVNYLNINSNTQLGTVCSVIGDGHPWQIIKTSGALWFVDSKGGLLRKVDITSPLNPIQSTTIQLNTFGGTAFTGLPNYKGSPAYFDTFFGDALIFGSYGVVNYFVYILESVSGSLYKLDIVNDAIVGEFQDRRLIGKKPMFTLNGKLYFTHFGDFEPGTGQNSGVSRNNIMKLDTNAVFGLGAVAAVNVGGDGEEPWGMAYRGKDVYIVFKNGDVKKFDPATDTITATYANVFQVAAGFVNDINVNLVGYRMFVCCKGKGTYFADISNVNGTMATNSAFAFQTLLGTAQTPLNDHYNFVVPDGKCYGVLTYGGEIPSGVARYALDGTFMDITRTGEEGFYNVTLINQPQNLQNSLC